MAIVEETIDEYVLACSTPTIGLTLTLTSQGFAGDDVDTEIPQIISSTANATSSVVSEAYMQLYSSAAAQSNTSEGSDIEFLMESSAHGVSSVIAEVLLALISTANGTSSVTLEPPTSSLSSSANASSSSAWTTGVGELAVSTANATSSANQGIDESLNNVANATSAVTPQRRASDSLSNTAEALDEAYPSASVTMTIASSAQAVSTLVAELVAQAILYSSAHAYDGYWYKDPSATAWVMNTESAAGWNYTNYQFDSIAQAGSLILATGGDGLYVISGDTDDGDDINGELRTGLMDFGDAQIKRVDNIYFAYTSNNDVSVTLEASGNPNYEATYTLEDRSNSAPVNTRLTPGKGMNARYWRLTVSGTDYSVQDQSIDIAVSPRRL